MLTLISFSSFQLGSSFTIHFSKSEDIRANARETQLENLVISVIYCPNAYHNISFFVCMKTALLIMSGVSSFIWRNPHFISRSRTITKRQILPQKLRCVAS